MWLVCLKKDMNVLSTSLKILMDTYMYSQKHTVVSKSLLHQEV